MPNGYPGPRGGYGASSEMDLIDHLVSELEKTECDVACRDEDGDAYCLVDRFVILQTIEVLKHYRKLLP